MGNPSEYEWSRTTDALRSAGSLGDAAELHGEFCGLACVMGADAVAPWVRSSLGDARSQPPDVVETLETLGRTTWALLESGDMSFGLLLPPDAEPLAKRAEALGAWCQGFMHGLGAAGQTGSANPVVNNETIAEIIADFSEITRADFAGGDDEEEGEAAWAELVEYTRVSVQLIFEELHGIRAHPAGSNTH